MRNSGNEVASNPVLTRIQAIADEARLAARAVLEFGSVMGLSGEP